MIGFLKGVLLSKTPDFLLVEVSGVGYEVQIPASSFCILPPMGKNISLYIYTHVREDAIRLFGFASLFDRKVFDLLLAVNSVGPKLAMSLLSPVNGIELCEALTSSNLKILVNIPGVGLKTAERLILELKDKAQKLLTVRNFYENTIESDALYTGNDKIDILSNDNKNKIIEKTLFNQRKFVLNDLESALINLGYKEKTVKDIVNEFDRKHKDENIIIESALKELLKILTNNK